MDIQFVGRLSLPFFITEKYRLTNEELKNKKITGYIRNKNNKPSYIVDFIIQNKNKSYYASGIRSYEFNEYEFNYDIPIVYKKGEYLQYV